MHVIVCVCVVALVVWQVIFGDHSYVFWSDECVWKVPETKLKAWILFQDDYMEALARLHLTVTRAYKVNTDINFEVFIHKVDGLSDDHKIETQRDIHQRANDDLADAGLEKIHLR